ncbi:MAG: hypothetical protein M3211_02895, partial [Actinomycetota bacterium]|nr:hypothetical protein [Actinomycetota bacterium]
MLVPVIALLFVLLFAHALRSFVHRHDPLAGEVTLLFGAMTGLFVLSLSGRLLESAPTLSAVVSAVSAAVLLLVPLLTLRLVSRFRPLPAWLLPAAALLYVVSTLPVVLSSRPLPDWVTWEAVVAFAATEVVAAGYFALEGGDRSGAARIRLYVAAVATALFAAALVAAPLDLGPLAQTLALLSAAGYVAGFMPPRPVRSMSTMAAAHMYGRQLLTGSVQPSTSELWQRFARAVRELSEADAVVILARTNDGNTTTVASAGADVGDDVVTGAIEFEKLNRLSQQRRINAECPVESALADRVGARYATVVPLPAPYSGVPEHIAVMLSERRSLFSGDDLEVVSDLGAQAALLSGRAAA